MRLKCLWSSNFGLLLIHLVLFSSKKLPIKRRIQRQKHTKPRPKKYIYKTFRGNQSQNFQISTTDLRIRIKIRFHSSQSSNPSLSKSFLLHTSFSYSSQDYILKLTSKINICSSW